MCGGGCEELDEEDGAFLSPRVCPAMHGCRELDEVWAVVVSLPGGPLGGEYEYPVHR